MEEFLLFDFFFYNFFFIHIEVITPLITIQTIFFSIFSPDYFLLLHISSHYVLIIFMLLSAASNEDSETAELLRLPLNNLLFVCNIV